VQWSECDSYLAGRVCCKKRSGFRVAAASALQAAYTPAVALPIGENQIHSLCFRVSVAQKWADIARDSSSPCTDRPIIKPNTSLRVLCPNSTSFTVLGLQGGQHVEDLVAITSLCSHNSFSSFLNNTKNMKQRFCVWYFLMFLRSLRRLLVIASVVPSSPILVTPMKEALSSPKRRFLQEPHGVTSQKTPFFIVTTVKTSNLTTFL
jgi:hypothetical protein